MKRRSKIILGVTLTVCLVPIVMPLVYCAVASYALRRAVANLEKAGYPTSWEQLAATLPDIDSDRSGQKAFYEAVNALRHVPHAPDNQRTNLIVEGTARLPDLGDPIPQHMLAALEERLKQVEKPLGLLRESVHGPPFLLKDKIELGNPSAIATLAGIRIGARLFKMQAIHAAENGDADMAIASVVDGIRLAEALETSPIIINGLVRIACERIAYDSLEFVLARTDPSSAQITHLDQILAQTEIDMKVMLRGELAFGISNCERLLGDPKAISNTLSWHFGAGQRNIPSFGPLGKAWIKMATVSQLRSTRMALELWDLPWDKFRTAYSKEMPDESSIHFVTALPPDAMVTLRAKELEVVAMRSCVRLALAIERFSQKGRRLPNALADLKPEYLTEIPSDPYLGGSFEYALTTENEAALRFQNPCRNKPTDFVILP